MTPPTPPAPVDLNALRAALVHWSAEMDRAASAAESEALPFSIIDGNRAVACVLSDALGVVAELEAARAEVAHAKNELRAFKQVLVEATVEPFDVGACVICGPIESDMLGKPLAVTEKVLEGVFEQLLQRVEAQVPNVLKSVNAHFDELNNLRAHKHRVDEAYAYACEVHNEIQALIDTLSSP